MTLLIFQMAIVLAMSLVCGRIALRCGQARVIGEIVGGILLRAAQPDHHEYRFHCHIPEVP